MKAQTSSPLSIPSTALAEFAGPSRERALAARRAVAELSREEAAAVGGAAYLSASYMLDRPFPRGTLPFWKMTDILSSGMF